MIMLTTGYTYYCSIKSMHFVGCMGNISVVNTALLFRQT